MDNPFFSIIIPTYNRAHLIKRPVESVLTQTFPSWELIVVDDGSSDNTGQVIQSFNDPRIRYIHQPNRERSAARNNGIRHAKGQYICFLDSDDYYLPGHLESFYLKIESEKFPIALLYCDTYEDINGKLIEFPATKIEARNNVEWVVQAFLGSPRTCIHREILAKHQFNPSITLGEDVDLWVRVLKEYPVIYNRSCTVVFCAHAGRTVDREESIRAQLSLYKRIFRDDGGKYISRKVKNDLMAAIYQRLGNYYISKGQKGKALDALSHALLESPSYRTRENLYLILSQFPALLRIFIFFRTLFAAKRC